MNRPRLSPEEYVRRYADACVKADVVPAPVLAETEVEVEVDSPRSGAEDAAAPPPHHDHG